MTTSPRRLPTTRWFLPALIVALAGSAAVGVGTPAAAQEGATVYLPVAAKHAPAFPTQPPPSATPRQTRTPTPPPSATATPTDAATAVPTDTPTVTPSPTFDGPEWLDYVIYHRALAGLGPVTENGDWSRGGELHAKYMVMNNVIGHSQSPSRPHYTPEGNEAAANGNVYLMAATNYYGTYVDAIDSWMTGPFHMLPIIDPKLAVTGFGEYAADFDRWHRYGATLDVHRGKGEVPPGVRFPIYYPRDGQHIPNLSYDGGESPDPLVACPGYTEPTGPPVALQLGTGDITPDVRRTSFRRGTTELAHCWFDETKYKSQPGQLGLDVRDAIVIMPRQPLTAGESYDVTIELADATYAWSFTALQGRPTDGGPAWHAMMAP